MVQVFTEFKIYSKSGERHLWSVWTTKLKGHSTAKGTANLIENAWGERSIVKGRKYFLA